MSFEIGNRVVNNEGRVGNVVGVDDATETVEILWADGTPLSEILEWSDVVLQGEE